MSSLIAEWPVVILSVSLLYIAGGAMEWDPAADLHTADNDDHIP